MTGATTGEPIPGKHSNTESAVNQLENLGIRFRIKPVRIDGTEYGETVGNRGLIGTPAYLSTGISPLVDSHEIVHLWQGEHILPTCETEIPAWITTDADFGAIAMMDDSLERKVKSALSMLGISPFNPSKGINKLAATEEIKIKRVAGIYDVKTSTLFWALRHYLTNRLDVEVGYSSDYEEAMAIYLSSKATGIKDYPQDDHKLRLAQALEVLFPDPKKLVNRVETSGMKGFIDQYAGQLSETPTVVPEESEIKEKGLDFKKQILGLAAYELLEKHLLSPIELREVSAGSRQRMTDIYNRYTELSHEYSDRSGATDEDDIRRFFRDVRSYVGPYCYHQSWICRSGSEHGEDGVTDQ